MWPTKRDCNALYLALRCAARGPVAQGRIFFLSLPTLFGFAFARLQGGLTHVAPNGAGDVHRTKDFLFLTTTQPSIRSARLGQNAQVMP